MFHNAESKLNTRFAKKLCKTCAVRVECLEYSLQHEPWGIWGGHDEQVRAYIRATRNIKLSRDGRINYTYVGLRDASGEIFDERPDLIERAIALMESDNE
jgi:hypothetical protein